MGIREEVFALIPRLSSADLRAVRELVVATESLVGTKHDEDIASDWLLAGMVTFLVREGHIAERAALFTLGKRKAYKTYRLKQPAVLEYLARLEQQAHTYTRHRPKLAFLCARALASLLERQNIFSVSAMLTQIDKLPEAIEAAFPSYAASNLFRFVIDNMEDVE